VFAEKKMKNALEQIQRVVEAPNNIEKILHASKFVMKSKKILSNVTMFTALLTWNATTTYQGKLLARRQ
jgi:hypothetical protein